jgi:hypothetical protein
MELLRLFSVCRSTSTPKPKPLKFYNRKSKGSSFSKLDDSLIVEAVSMFSTPPVETSPKVAHDSKIESAAVRISPPTKGSFTAGVS